MVSRHVVSDDPKGEITWATPQQARKLDNLHSRYSRRNLNLQRNPACATSIHACREHRCLTVPLLKEPVLNLGDSTREGQTSSSFATLLKPCAHSVAPHHADIAGFQQFGRRRLVPHIWSP